MFRKDLGVLTLWRLKCLKKVGSAFGLTFTSVIAILISTKANAAYQCAVTAETCAWMYTGVYVQLVCKPITTCIWVPDPSPPPAPPPPPVPTSPSSPPPTSLERQQCLDNADSAGRKCSEAYGSAKTMCDTANALLAGGTGRGLINLAVWKQLVSKDSKELVDAITAATGTLGFTVETVFPCNQWNSIAVGYCATGVQNLKSKCPAK